MDKKIWKNFLKAIKDFNMIENNDKIGIGLSGGKDSLLLVKLFARLKKAKNINFDFVAITLDPGFDEDKMARVKKFVDEIAPYEVYDVNIWKILDERDEKHPCSLCAKLRRGILYDKAEKLGCNKLALGHHFDDIIETVLINMFYGGTIKTMLPKIKSSTGNFDLIRQLAYLKEEEIITYATENNFPTMKDEGCKILDTCKPSKRLFVKNLLKDLEEDNKNVKSSIWNSISNVNLEYIMQKK